MCLSKLKFNQRKKENRKARKKKRKEKLRLKNNEHQSSLDL